MNKLAKLHLTPQERKAINTFSRRVKRALGKRLLTLRLFGSKARGDFHAESDIDIYMVVKNKTSRVLDQIAQIEADILDEFDIFLSCATYSAYEEKKNLEMHSFFFEEVQREGIPI